MADADGQDWHDRRAVAWAAGAAALALVGLLVIAVLRVSDGSSRPGDVPLPETSAAATTAAPRTTSSTSTRYTVPSVQTSEATGPPAPPPTAAPTEDQSGPAESTTSTTIHNPYGTTTPTNAGHI